VVHPSYNWTITLLLAKKTSKIVVITVHVFISFGAPKNIYTLRKKTIGVFWGFTSQAKIQQ